MNTIMVIGNITNLVDGRDIVIYKDMDQILNPYFIFIILPDKRNIERLYCDTRDGIFQIALMGQFE